MSRAPGSRSSRTLVPSRLDPTAFAQHASRSPLGGKTSPLISAIEWTKQRCRIRQLYLVDGLTRQQTRLIMKHRYGFDASDVQYKYQIKKWSFQKSLTHEDKKLMAQTRSQLQSEAITPIFLLCGKPIPKAKVSRQTRGITSASPEEDERVALMPGMSNLSWTPSKNNKYDTAIRELRSLSMIKHSNLIGPDICCLTCLECELDWYQPFDFLWNSPFDSHLVRRHAKISHKFGLVWCMVDPALPDAPDPQIIHEWNYAREDMPENTGLDFYDHYPSLKDMLRLLDPMSITSIIEEETPTKTLWLVDLSNEDQMKTLATISRCADETPRDLIQSLLTEISSGQDRQPSSSPATHSSIEIGSYDPEVHDLDPTHLYGMDYESLIRRV